MIKTKLLPLFILLVFASTAAFAQKKPNAIPAAPKLVVGIVVDQMRYDFLYRYLSKYGKGGFRRLMNEGFNNKNAQYPYVPTYTAPGHSSIFAGTVPAISGMIANDWYSRQLKRSVYCTEDSTVQTVGSPTKAGQMSPKNMLVTTITDQLRLASNFQSKVIGISLKDRASILPAGHTANAAYWMDGANGNFITSTYYMRDLPAWVTKFNDEKHSDKYLAKPWNTLLPIEQYTASTGDSQPYEQALPGETVPTFPHDLETLKIKTKDYEIIKSTPFGNTVTTEFAEAAIQNESLGKMGNTDFLTISYSSTDYVGHAFGPNSIEIEDTYLRLDKTLEHLLNFLDQQLGKENVLVFLTADHGVANVPAFNQEHHLPGGVFGEELVKTLKNALSKEFGTEELISNVVNDEIYLNNDFIERKKVDRREILAVLKKAVQNMDGINTIIDLHNLSSSSLPESRLSFFRNGYYEKRSGDFQIVTEPGWFSGRSKGTTHGTNSAYDTHIPLLWFGWKVNPGESSTKVFIPDIAATLAYMLNILEPSGCIGNVIRFQ